MAPSTRSRNFEACATPSPIAHGTGMRSTPWSNCVSRRMPSHGGWRSSGLRTAIRIIRRSHRDSMPTTAGPSTAIWSRRCRRALCARRGHGAWMTPACSRRSRLRKRLDHHHEDDGEGDYKTNDPVDRRLSVESLVGGAGQSFLLEHLDLLSEDARVKADGHHDQQDEENQGGDHPAFEAPLADGEEYEPGDEQQSMGGGGDPAGDEGDASQREERVRGFPRR